MSVCLKRKQLDEDEDVDIPDVILSARRYYRIRYFGLSTFLMILVYSVPQTDLYATTPGSVQGMLLACLVFVVYAVASTSFYLVQGSDPGYLFVEETVMDDEENPKHEHEQQSLLPEACIDTTATNSANSHQVPLLLQHHSEYRPGGPSCALEVETITPTIPRHRLRHTHTNKTTLTRSNEGGDSNHQQQHFPGNGEANHHSMYCQWCAMSVPLRSHHCKICQRCVATFDHHCTVIGTCIGEKNHCRFFTFCCLNFLGLWYYSVLVDTAFVNKHVLNTNMPVVQGNTGVTIQSYQSPTPQQFQPQSALSAPPPYQLPIQQPAEIAYIASIILGILWWYVLILLAYQTFLVATGATGYECVKGPERLFYLRGANSDADGKNNNNNNNNGAVGGSNSISDSSASHGGSSTANGTIGTGPNDGVTTHQEGYYPYPTTTDNERNDGYEICDMPFGSNICQNIVEFCCERDGMIQAYRRWRAGGATRSKWRPRHWTRPPPKQDIHTVEVCDNLWRNKHYSCC